MAKKPRSSRPFIERTITLNNYDAQHLYKRSYEHTSDSFFLLGIILPVLGDEEAADEYAGQFAETLRTCTDDLHREIDRMKVLLEENGLSPDDVQYTKPKEIKARISSPMDSLYLGLIQLFDELAGLMSVLWISGMFDQKQYRQGIMSWRRRIMRLGSKVSGNVKQALSAAKRQGKAEAVETAMQEHGVSVREDLTSKSDLEDEQAGEEGSQEKDDADQPAAAAIV